MIRLQRKGKKHQASYRLAVGEKKSKLNGEQLEDLGWFNPHLNKSEFNKERIEFWLQRGAQMSATVNNLLLKAGIIKGEKIAKHKKAKKSEEKKEEVKKEEKQEVKKETA